MTLTLNTRSLFSSLCLLIPMFLPGYGSRSCCKNADLDEFDTIINQKLGSFQRILRGESFRIQSIQVSEGSLPPARILDMAINVHRETHELEFTWTAPGEDYDHGKVIGIELRHH